MEYIITINKYAEKERQACHGLGHKYIIMFYLETCISILFI